MDKSLAMLNISICFLQYYLEIKDMIIIFSINY